jgi:hypothetical protein
MQNADSMIAVCAVDDVSSSVVRRDLDQCCGIFAVLVALIVRLVPNMCCCSREDLTLALWVACVSVLSELQNKCVQLPLLL